MTNQENKVMMGRATSWAGDCAGRLALGRRTGAGDGGAGTGWVAGGDMAEDGRGSSPPLFERFWGKWAYLVVPEGIAGVRCDIEDGERISWRGWTIDAVATPGHSPDHFAYVARRTSTAGGRVSA